MISKGNTSEKIQGRGVWRLKLTNKRSALCWCLMSFTRMRLTQMRWRWRMVWLESQLRPAANGPSVVVAWLLGPVQQRQLKSPACHVRKMNLMTDRRKCQLLQGNGVIGYYWHVHCWCIWRIALYAQTLSGSVVRSLICLEFRYLLPNGWWLFLPNCFSKDQLKVQSKLIKLQYLISPDLCVFIWRFDLERLEGQSFCEDGPRECPKCAPYLAQKGAGVPLWAPSLHWKAVESSGTLVFCLFWYWSTAWSLQNRKSRTVFQFSELYFLHSSIARAWLSGSVPSHSIVCIATSASLSTACRPSAFRSTGGHSLQLLKMDEKGAPKRAAPMAIIPSRILTGFLFTINSKQSDGLSHSPPWVSHRCAGHLGYWDAAGDVAGRVRDTRFPLFRYTPWEAREGSKMGGWNRCGGVDGPKFGQKTILPEINSESTIYQYLPIGKSSNHPQSKPSWEMLCWFRGG